MLIYRKRNLPGMCQYCVATALAAWNLYYRNKELIHEKGKQLIKNVRAT